jgi:DNA-binding response OmpR family regulator
MIESSSAKNPLALIIEDNEAVAGIFKMALKLAEFEVEHIGDGRTALERLAVVTPTLILLDLHLPHVSGKQILHYIRAEERLAKTRVILASADLPQVASLEHKADFVLVKPFGFNKLHNLATRLRLPDVVG